jgi:hypothetical protein
MCYNPDAIATSEIELGTFELKPSGNEFSVVVTGSNPQAEQGYMFGLDYLRLQPVGAP